MELNTFQAPALDVIHFPGNVLDILMPSAQAGKLRVLPAFFLDKLVDGAHLFYLGGHRAHQEPVDAGLGATLGQHMGQAHILHGDMVKIPHGAGGLFRDLSRIDVGVGIRYRIGRPLMKHRHLGFLPFFFFPLALGF